MLFTELEDYLQKVIKNQGSVHPERQTLLHDLAEYIAGKRSCNLVFICTHNSRRSHFAQIWAEIFFTYHKLGNVAMYSGGTEATAFNPNAVAAIIRAGIKVEALSQGENPVYVLKSGHGEKPIYTFSKSYDHFTNPKSEFAAVMTCSDADENCPVVFGSQKRVALTYEDPKISDGTEYEQETYDKRCFQIATEMHYLSSCVKEALN